MNKDKIENAYLRLKNYFFYSNNSIFYKIKISKFENRNFKKKLNDINSLLNGNEELLDELLGKISYFSLPKSFEYNTEISEIISNKYLGTNIKVLNEIKFIDAPIELFIISMLWVIELGYKYDRDFEDYLYGNRLNLNQDRELKKENINTFNKYYENYSKWRDGAIESVKINHQSGISSLIFNLDVTNYYHSINLKEDYLYIDKSNILNKIILKIHKAYNSVTKNKRLGLPIGLPSSHILANLYLIPLDKMFNNINYSYYGRYVDDILIVIPKSIDKNYSQIDIQKLLKSCGFTFSNKKHIYNFSIDKNKLEIKNEKLKLFYIDSEEPLTFIEEFERNIYKNSSEFRFLPDSDSFFSQIDSEFYTVNYEDTYNKLRSIEKIKTNKYGVSKSLSKLINIVSDLNGITIHNQENIIKKIRSFFSGFRALDLILYTEKAFTYYVLTGNKKEFFYLFHNILSTIKSIDVGNGINKEKLKKSLFEHLIFSMCMAISYNPDFIKFSSLQEQIEELGFKSFKINSILLNSRSFLNTISSIISANMMRHNILKVPLINYLNNSTFRSIQKKSENLIYKKMNKQKLIYSPRYIHLSEIMLWLEMKPFLFSNIKVKEKFYVNHLYSLKIHKALYPNSPFIKSKNDVIEELK